MGKIRLKIQGLNTNRMLNTLNAKNIEVYCIERKEYNEILMSIDSCNLSVVKEYIKHNGLDFEIVGGSGIFYWAKTFWYRFGLILGFILSSIAIMTATNYYWNVDVRVDTNNPDIIAEVKELLSSQGIEVGAKITELQSREIERLILESVEDSALVVVTKEGVKLDVFVKESTKQENLVEKGIVASFGGVIEEIKLSSGNLLVNIGDSVVAGQVLVESGKVGDVFMEAQGSVVARVQIEGDSVGGLEKVATERSGNFIEVSYFDVLGKKFYSGELREEEALKHFERFEIEQEEQILSQNNLLPIKKIVIRYYEILEKCVTIEYEELIKQLSESAYSIAFSRMPEGAEALSVTYKVIQEGSLYKVVCSIETRIDIAKRAENHTED